MDLFELVEGHGGGNEMGVFVGMGEGGSFVQWGCVCMSILLRATYGICVRNADIGSIKPDWGGSDVGEWRNGVPVGEGESGHGEWK
ncbi:Hypothetical predicted protein, partial [Olea europaea subsp. europaea]